MIKTKKVTPVKYRVILLFLIIFAQGRVFAQPVKLEDFTHRQRMSLFRALLFGFNNLPEDLSISRVDLPKSDKVELTVTNGEGQFKILEPKPGASFSVLTSRELSRREDIAASIGNALIFDEEERPNLPGLRDLRDLIKTAEKAKVSPQRVNATAAYSLQQSFLNLYVRTGERSALQLLAWLLGRNDEVRNFQFGKYNSQSKDDLLKPTFYLPNENLAADYLLVMTHFALRESDPFDDDSDSEISSIMAAIQIQSVRLLTLRLRGSAALQENPDLNALADPLRQDLDQFNSLASTAEGKELYKNSTTRKRLIEAARRVRATIATSDYYKANFLWPKQTCNANLSVDREHSELR